MAGITAGLLARESSSGRLPGLLASDIMPFVLAYSGGSAEESLQLELHPSSLSSPRGHRDRLFNCGQRPCCGEKFTMPNTWCQQRKPLHLDSRVTQLEADPHARPVCRSTVALLSRSNDFHHRCGGDRGVPKFPRTPAHLPGKAAGSSAPFHVHEGCWPGAEACGP